MLAPSLSPRSRLAVTAALVAVAISSCTPAEQGGATSAAPTLPAFTTTQPPPTTSSTQPAAPVDYPRLLLTAADLSDDEDTFVQRSSEEQPNGTPGASAFFVNEADTRAIADTVLVYPDAATATATLKQASGTLASLVAGGTPTPLPVGTDGVTISGTHPTEDKAVTLVFFTEGPALVRLEFQSAEGDATTDRFVTAVAKMQQIALRVGLPDSP